MANSFLLNSWKTIRELEMLLYCTLMQRHLCDLSDHTDIASTTGRREKLLASVEKHVEGVQNEI